MVNNFCKNVILGILIACSVYASMLVGNGENPNDFGQQRDYITSVKNFAQEYFNGWGPTLTFLTGVSWYTVQKDRQAPIKAFSWIKNFVVETDPRIKYPALLLSGCLFSTYYKDRCCSLYWNRLVPLYAAFCEKIKRSNPSTNQQQ